MKRYTAIALVLVLTAAIMAGCRSKNNPNSGANTQYTTMPTTSPATMPTETIPEPTQTTATMPTVDNGNGPLDDSTDIGSQQSGQSGTGGENAQGEMRSSAGTQSRPG